MKIGAQIVVLSAACLLGAQGCADLASLNNNSFEFHGRLVDQMGEPVGNAVVVAKIRSYGGGNAEEQIEKIAVPTDGRFTVKGSGESLSFEVQAPGYSLSDPHTEFHFSEFYRDRVRDEPGAVRVVKMWKRTGDLVDLKRFHVSTSIDSQQSIVFVDLLNQRIGGVDGDLKLSIERQPNALGGNKESDWSIRIQAIDGGVMEVPTLSEEFTFEAPDHGYEPSIRFEAKGKTGGIPDYSRELFVVSRGGRVHASLYLHFAPRQPADPDKMVLSVQGEGNFDGSRNWQDRQRMMR